MKQNVPKPVAIVIALVALAVLVVVGYRVVNPQNEVNANMEERKRRMGDYAKSATMTGGKQDFTEAGKK